MSAGETLARGGIGKFLAWWVGELATLVPPAMRRFFAPAKADLVVELSPDTVTVRRARGAQHETLATFDCALLEPAAVRAGIERAVKSAGRGRRSAILRLSDPRLLSETTRLPAAAAENLRETMLYQLDRLTPFSADEVYFDCRQTGAPAADGFVDVELIVAPRAVVDEAVSRAATWGLEPTSISPAGTLSHAAAKTLNLLPGEVKRGNRFARLNAALAAIALCLLGVALYLPYDRDRETARILSARIEMLRAEARVATRLNEQIAAAEKERNLISDRKRRAVSVTRTLDDLTRLLPDTSWISQFRWTGDRGQIVGHGPSSSEIIGLIERSDRFSGARMLTPVRRDGKTDIERFNLSFSIRGEPNTKKGNGR